MNAELVMAASMARAKAAGGKLVVALLLAGSVGCGGGGASRDGGDVRALAAGPGGAAQESPHELEAVADGVLRLLVERFPDGDHGVAVLEGEGRIEVVTTLRLDEAASVLAELGATDIADIRPVDGVTLFPRPRTDGETWIGDGDGTGDLMAPSD